MNFARLALRSPNKRERDQLSRTPGSNSTPLRWEREGREEQETHALKVSVGDDEPPLCCSLVRLELGLCWLAEEESWEGSGEGAEEGGGE